MLYGDLYLRTLETLEREKERKREKEKKRKRKANNRVHRPLFLPLTLCLWGDIKRNRRIGSPKDLRRWADHKLAIPGKSPSRPIVCFYTPPVFSFSSAQEQEHVVRCSNSLIFFLFFPPFPLSCFILFSSILFPSYYDNSQWKWTHITYNYIRTNDVNITANGSKEDQQCITIILSWRK